MKKFIEIIASTFVLKCLLFCSQQQKFKYTVIKKSHLPRKIDTIIYYYILNDDKRIIIDKKKFNQFIFDTDSSKITGFIRFERNKILFSKDKVNYQSINFDTGNFDIIKFGEFGSKIDILPKRKGLYNVVQKALIPSHRLYVSRIKWKKNKKYPSEIIFKEKGSSKEYFALPEK